MGIKFAHWYFYSRQSSDHAALLLHPIERKKIPITIVERGSLESAENNDIVCKVKARAQGASATNIRWVIDNGSAVRKGDKIVELDDSALQDQYVTQEIVMEKAKGDYETAEQKYLIDQLTNDGLIKTAEVALKVAHITLQEYLEGQYEQSRIDFENKLMMARSDLAMWEERASWSDRMSQPGRQFVTVSQAEADQARRLSAELTLNNLKTQFRVLNDLTKKKFNTQYGGDVEEKVRALERAKLTAEATRIQDDVLRKTTKLTYEKELGKLRDIDKEIQNCIINAPKSGMLVYWIEERSRFGGGKQRFIAQGEAVDEGQKLAIIPNLSRMVVNTKVHEAMAPRVKGDKKKDTGFDTVAEFGLYLHPDPFTTLLTRAAFVNDLRTPFKNAHRELETKLASSGQKATIRISAFPDQTLHGHVREVAQVASQNDFFASDVKVYQTYVTIDDSLPGLKPGMDAEVTILVDTQPEPVLAIPLQAVLGSADMGAKRKCFVKLPEGPQMREITLGMSNEKMAEVKDGLVEGDVVVLNPAVLLSEKERMEYGVVQGRGGPGGGRQGPGGRKAPGGAPGGPPAGGGIQGGPPAGGTQGGGTQGGAARPKPGAQGQGQRPPRAQPTAEGG